MPCADGCGWCCDPVVVAKASYDRIMHLAESGADAGENASFIARHWQPHESYSDPDGVVWLRLSCGKFDARSRSCTAYGDRPPACSGYPWYGRGPNAGDATFLPPQCSFLAELPAGERPPDARPLIPITPVRG